MNPGRIGASFRDPSGFVYAADGVIHRQVNRSYRQHYDLLMSSGLYDALVRNGSLIPHQEIDVAPLPAEAYRILRPQPIRYISYPYEWCFSQLKDAALLTLDVQLSSLSFGMTLKDASAYNVQFVGSRPVFIDTLSFETYTEGTPWVAYKQFCEHFLAPLALMSHVDTRLGHLLRRYLDGIPLDLASRLLPATSRLRPGLFLHIHAHARSQKRHERDGRTAQRLRLPSVSKNRLIALMENLRGVVRRCRPRHDATEWSDYYQDTSYPAAAMAEKEAAVQGMIDTFADSRDTIHDIGANTGRFSRLLAGAGRYVVSHDIDEGAVERNYLHNRAHSVDGVLPLLLDLTNPSPPIGWALAERASALERLSNDTVVALALVHHLAISNHVPLRQLAEFFAGIASTLIIEFVPKEDSQVQRLLATRTDAFPDYRQDHFETAFSAFFDILAKKALSGMPRTLYAMRRRP